MQIKNLTMSFGTQVLFENINLNIPENEKVGVVGVNGAGKTTFFKMVVVGSYNMNGSIFDIDKNNCEYTKKLFKKFIIFNYIVNNSNFNI